MSTYGIKRVLRYLFAVMMIAVLLAGCGTGGQAGTAGTSVSTASAETESDGSSEIEASEAGGDSEASDISETGEAADNIQQETSAPEETEEITDGTDEEDIFELDEDGWYSSKEEVALYIYTYGHLPGNYITKNEARDLGWDNKKGNLDEVAPGMSIGGDKFGNYEGLLPDAKGRKYYECDIDYEGGFRGAKRIIFSNDGLVYYTEDHYNTFELLYGEE